MDQKTKIHALRLICLRYAPDNMDAFEQEMKGSFSAAGVWKIQISKLRGKCNK